MEKMIFVVRKVFGDIIDAFLGIIFIVWDKAIQAIEKIRDKVIQEDSFREIFLILGFLISPRKIMARIFRFNAGELILFLVGWGMTFSWFVITMIQHTNQLLGLIVLPLGPIMYFIGTGGIVIMSVVFGMQAERFAEKTTEKAEKRRQNYAEFLEKYPQTN